MVIGITGPIAAGKSTLVKKFKFYHFDCDVECKRIAKEHEKEIEEIFKRYGYTELNNEKISKIIFSNKIIYDEYTNFVYDILRSDFLKACEVNKDIIIDGVNLYIFKDLLDEVIYVSVNPIIRFIRLIKRDIKKHTFMNLLRKYFKQVGLFSYYKNWEIPVLIFKGE